MTLHRILGAQTNWTPDCYHLFYLTATEFIKIPMSLLLPLLEHKFVQGGKYGERGIFRHTSYLVQEQFHKIAFIRAISPAEVGLVFCSQSPDFNKATSVSNAKTTCTSAEVTKLHFKYTLRLFKRFITGIKF